MTRRVRRSPTRTHFTVQMLCEHILTVVNQEVRTLARHSSLRKRIFSCFDRRRRFDLSELVRSPVHHTITPSKSYVSPMRGMPDRIFRTSSYTQTSNLHLATYSRSRSRHRPLSLPPAFHCQLSLSPSLNGCRIFERRSLLL